MTTCPTCTRHLERTYPAAQCPRCLADVVLTDAVRDLGFSERTLHKAAITAELLLHEDPKTLARFTKRLEVAS